MTVATSADTVAAAPGANVVIAAATSPSAVSFTGSPQTATARSTWTIGFTTSATGALHAGDTITVGFSARFTIPSNPTITLTGAYSNCSATGVVLNTTSTTASNDGPKVVITLADNGGTCSLASSASGALTIAGIINVIATTITAANLNVLTSTDTVQASPGANVTIAAATTPTAVSFAGSPRPATPARPGRSASPPARAAPSRTGGSVIIGFSAGFSIPANPTITLTGAGWSNCSATGSTNGTAGSVTGPTLTVTLADNGGTCALANSGNGPLTIAGVINPPAQTIAETSLSVSTSTDYTAANPGATVTIGAATTPTGVSFTGSPQTGVARSTWTIGYTATATGALKVGDTITVGFAAGFSVPANPTVTLTGAYTNCSASAVTDQHLRLDDRADGDDHARQQRRQLRPRQQRLRRAYDRGSHQPAGPDDHGREHDRRDERRHRRRRPRRERRDRRRDRPDRGHLRRLAADAGRARDLDDRLHDDARAAP